jgi:hypothetical protein
MTGHFFRNATHLGVTYCLVVLNVVNSSLYCTASGPFFYNDVFRYRGAKRSFSQKKLRFDASRMHVSTEPTYSTTFSNIVTHVEYDQIELA